MLTRRPLLNTLLLLLALLATTQRVLTPFSIPPLVVHPSGYIQICSWQSGFQPLLIDAQGERQESLQPQGHCPACAVAAALPETSPLAFLANLPVTTTATPYKNTPLQHNHLLFGPPVRAPPVVAG
jgi:hypothetical protein